MMMSRLCALEWVVVLYESVVPDVLKAEVSLSISSVALSKLISDRNTHHNHNYSNCSTPGNSSLRLFIS